MFVFVALPLTPPLSIPLLTSPLSSILQTLHLPLLALIRVPQDTLHTRLRALRALHRRRLEPVQQVNRAASAPATPARAGAVVGPADAAVYAVLGHGRRRLGNGNESD